MTGPANFVPPVRWMDPGVELVRPDWTSVGYRDPKLLWLDKNENTDPVLQAVVYRVLAEMDPRNVTVYPDPAALYHKLAEYLGVSPRALVLAQGSDGVIGSVFRTFVAPGDGVLFPSPTYAMYEVYASMSGAATTRLEYSPGPDGPLLEPAAMIHEIKKRRPKLVCLPNPDSPTGTVVEPDALRAIVLCAREVGSMILIDEAYYPFYQHTVLPWLEEFPNLVVARTFSKAWGLTGLRLGYGIASPEVAAAIQKFRPNYEVNSVAVAMALRMISDFEHEMRASVARLNEGRDGFMVAMRNLGLGTLASRGSFCHVAFGHHAKRIHARLSDMVLYRQDFSAPCLKGFSRFSSTTNELFAPVIGCIQTLMAEGG